MDDAVPAAISRITPTRSYAAIFDVGEEESIATIHYAGEGKEVTIRSHWREVDGRPMIGHGEPVTA
jgi:hypothetical protein